MKIAKKLIRKVTKEKNLTRIVQEKIIETGGSPRKILKQDILKGNKKAPTNSVIELNPLSSLDTEYIRENHLQVGSGSDFGSLVEIMCLIEKACLVLYSRMFSPIRKNWGILKL